MSTIIKFKGMDLGEVEMPFQMKLNFKKIFEFWEKQAQSENTYEAIKAKEVLKIVAKAPGLKGNIKDISSLEKYEKELTALLSTFFSPILTQNEIKAVCLPFIPIFIHPTERMKRVLGPTTENADNIMNRFFEDKRRYIRACLFILNFKYGAGVSLNKPFYFDSQNPVTKMKNHYRVVINGDFSDFIEPKGFKPLTDAEIKELLDNFDDLDLWKKRFPPDSFTYEGFSIFTLFDTTFQEAISAMKFDLLKKDALASPDKVEQIRLNLSSVLKLNSLKLGFLAFDKERNLLKSLGYGFWNSIVLSDKSQKKLTDTLPPEIIDKLFVEKVPVAVSDVKKFHKNDNLLSRRLMQHQLGSYLIHPLVYNQEVIGLLELGADKAYQLSSLVNELLTDVTPLFTTSLKRSMDEWETKLEAIIQEKCTAIHPSVSWRFFEAAENLLQVQQFYNTNEMEEIIFPNVFPLYGQSDIKGSSTARNSAIQEDLIEQLNLAKDVIQQAKSHSSLPLYGNLIFRMDNFITKTKQGLDAGDELQTLEFLKKEVYPVFKHIKEMSSGPKSALKIYNERLDPKLNIVYNKRKDYEESVTQINEKIAQYIEKAQIDAQGMFPHYFEKYQTDGVEHNIYIGQSLVNNHKYHKIYLQNMRLWQLLTICETELAVRRLKSQLKVPLDICSLILVHSNSLSIRFRQDEKKFDVDGAYNVRYEILKKRIDKAYVRGKKERLTITDHIAIVYSQDKEAQEYLQYIQYLQSIDYIKDEIEWLELDNMQGVTGLKALRIAVNYDPKTKLNGESKIKKALKIA